MNSFNYRCCRRRRRRRRGCFQRGRCVVRSCNGADVAGRRRRRRRGCVRQRARSGGDVRADSDVEDLDVCAVDDDEASVGGDEVERLRLDEVRGAGAGRHEAAVVASVARQTHDAPVVVVGHVDTAAVLATADRHAARHLPASDTLPFTGGGGGYSIRRIWIRIR